MKRPKPAAANRTTRTAGAPLVDVQSPRLLTAYRCWVGGERDDAMRLFAEAVRVEPNNVQAYLMKARAHAEQFEFDQMERTLDKLARRAPRHPGVHHYIGELFALIKLPDRAAASFAQAARLPGAGPPTWMELATLYERAHRLDEAEELIERTVRTGYDLPTVGLVRGRIQRRQKRLSEAETTFRKLIERLTEDSPFACQAWGEIALMKDGQGEFDCAIEAIQQCKRRQQKHQAEHWKQSEATEAQMREAIASITRDDFQRWQADGAAFEPRRAALLTGFPRSGTTLLEQVLAAHSGLVSSEERDFLGAEVMRALVVNRKAGSFRDALNGLKSDDINLQRDRYFRFMEYLLGEPIGGRLHLDKNPAYNLIIPLALRVFPEMRLIVALRDPRDVVLSCYLRYLPLNAVSVRYLTIDSTAERYALDMSAWLKYRELVSGPWCEVRYEDTVADVEGQARRVLDMLGLPWDQSVLDYRERMLKVKRVNSPTYEAVAEPIHKQAVGRWHNYEQLLAPAMKTLEPYIREFGYDN